MLTYYCVLQNQPRMRYLPMKDKSVIDVEFSDGTNMASTKGSHMHHEVFTFIDKDHYTVKWTNYENGESAYTVVLNMARARRVKAQRSKTLPVLLLDPRHPNMSGYCCATQSSTCCRGRLAHLIIFSQASACRAVKGTLPHCFPHTAIAN